ncbi:tetratricopeptide repeat protein [Salmonella enterica subsp. enterica serovar Daytona]|uniref:Tetratricopeptide repeat protein n=1 Tax=Salmonella enterica subsp. enterica serovar Daytona TaxID=1962639 RepID=A0A447JGD2_SALET|nr:tetratricopeptide repeat protein [Salmonella enterica subsp. enterica serovar Daytona]
MANAHIFYDNGVLKQKHSYLNQKLEGPAFEYFPDGKIKGKYSYSKGTIVGTSNGILFYR